MNIPPGIDVLPSGRYRARYRCDGCERHGKPNFHSASFDRLRDAKAWRTEQTSKVNVGQHTDPKAGRTTLQAFSEAWVTTRFHDPGTRGAVELRLRLHVYPVLGRHQLRHIKPSMIQGWLAGLHMSDSYKRLIFVNLSTVLNAAVADELITKNPCTKVTGPSVERGKVQPWPVERVMSVHDALPGRYQIASVLAAGLGLRQGEVFGLSPGDVDFLRGRVTVQRQAKLLANNRMIFGPPKGRKVRHVPLPASVRDDLAAYLTDYPAQDVTLPWDRLDGKPATISLVMSNREARATNRNYFNPNIWKPALVDAEVEPTRENGMHALRHFYASVLLDAGESIKAVSEYLGHSDPGFTLRTYTHLMPESAQRTRDAVDAAFCVTRVSPGTANLP